MSFFDHKIYRIPNPILCLQYPIITIEQARENLKVTKDNNDADVTGMSDLLEAQLVCQAALNRVKEAKSNFRSPGLNIFRQSISMSNFV